MWYSLLRKCPRISLGKLEFEKHSQYYNLVCFLPFFTGYIFIFILKEVIFFSFCFFEIIG